MKKITILLPIFVLLTIAPIAKPAWAATLDARLTQAIGRLDTMASKAAEHQTTELTKIQQSADTMIANRIASLNKLLSVVQSDTHLSDAEKTTLTTSINTMISNLQTLKAKIDADTDVTTARADRKTIVTSYHIYVTFEPQIDLLKAIDNLQTITTNVQGLVPLLQNLSNTLKSQGKDTTTMNAAITDINTQLATISTTLSTDTTTLSNISTTTDGNKTVFTQVRQDLAKVRADFAQIRHDIATIRGSIHTMISESSLNLHTSPTAHPTNTTPAPTNASSSAK